MNKGMKVDVKQYIARREEIKNEINVIVDKAEAENKREFTDEEKTALEHYRRELNVLDYKIMSADKSGKVEVSQREVEFDKFLREAWNNQAMQNNTLQREAILSTAADAMIPLTIGDIVKPLEDGLILKAVGLPMMTGLAGDFVWPVVGNVEAEVAGEAVELTDKTIDFGKVKPNPKRVGVSITITRQTVYKTDGVAYEVVRQQLPQAMARTLNKCMFGTDASVTHGLVGPFFDIVKNGTAKALSALKTKAERKAANYIAFAGALPTYKELLAMKALCLLKGVEPNAMAYIMDAYTAGMLEATPKDDALGTPIIENGKIAGIPVFTTNYINNDTDTFIGFGCWGYEPLQGFGDMSFVVDPYSKAKSDSVVLTLNSDFAMSTLRKEAFVLGKCAAE
jgi:HK97 family phage major capsid protein